MARGKKIAKGIGITLLVLAVIVCLPFLALHLALTTSITNKLLQIVPNYIKAEATIGKVDYSLYSTWPDVELSLNDVNVISTVFQPADTLLHADSLGVSLNLGDFLRHGIVKLNGLQIDNPNIRLKKQDGVTSLDMFPPSDTTDTDTASLALNIPDLYLRNIAINGGQLQLNDYDGLQDLIVRDINLAVPRGKYKFDSIMGGVELTIDTVVYDNHRIAAIYSLGKFNLDAKAAQVGSNIFTDVNINSPSVNMHDSIWKIRDRALEVYLRGRTDTTFHDIGIVNMSASIDSMLVALSGKIKVQKNRTVDTDLKLSLQLPEVSELLRIVPAPYKKYFKGLRVTGGINLEASAKGPMRKKDLPTINASLQIKNLTARYKQFPQGLDDLQLDVSAVYNDNDMDSTKVVVNKLLARTGKTAISTNGNFGFIDGRSYIDWAFKTHLNLQTVNNIYRIEPNSEMEGTLDADIKADFFLDDIKDRDFYKIFTTTRISGDGINIKLPDKKLNLSADSLRVGLNTNTGVKMRHRTDTALVNAFVGFRSFDINLDNSIKANSKRLALTFLADDLDSAKVPRLRASISMGGLEASVNDTTKLFSKRARASFNMRKSREYAFLPENSVTISMDTVLFSNPEIGAMLRKSDIKLTVLPRFRQSRRNAEGKRERIPLSEQPIIDLRALTQLTDSVLKADDKPETFLKTFRLYGDIKVNALRAKSPTNPVRMSLNQVDVKFSDDTLHLNDITLRYGRSKVTLSGDVNNMRRYFLRGRTLSANLSLTSQLVDLNQIMRSMYMSRSAAEEMGKDTTAIASSVSENLEELSLNLDETQEEELAAQAIDSTVQASLIAIPKNLDIKFNANIDTVRFARMQLRDFRGNVTIDDSSLRLKHFSTSTQLGNAGLNVMYTCENVEKASAAMSVNMDSVQIGSIVDYFPELDSIMPMLRSFSGSVSCEASASADLDSLMNVDMPSINAGLWLRGENLTLLDGETFSEIAKMLMFNKRTENLIDSVSVELLVQNNQISIYPFMVGMDKYRLGVGGRQHLDGSFNYHIVLLKSPLLFRIGLDVYGDNFDNIKFKLSSPQFKDFDVDIGSGGTLINTAAVNVRKALYDAVMKSILETDETD